MVFAYGLILVASALLFSWVGTALLVKLLPRLAVMDTPNERSNHKAPVPRGGGIAVSVAMLGFLMVAGVSHYVIVAGMVLAILSFLDDVWHLPASARFTVHLLCAGLVASTIHIGILQEFLPFHTDTLLLTLFLTWFLNAYNFMDGIDEITAVETTSIMAGIALLAGLSLWVPNATALPLSLIIDALIIIASTCGFWWWNRHPAKIFLGDVGSIPLGLVTGYLLLHLAELGYWAPALILPAYYLTDAGYTMTKRLLSGKKIWEAHSEHAYQKAVRGGLTHRQVTRRILTLNVLLIALALLSLVDVSTFLTLPDTLAPLATLLPLVYVAIAYFLAISWRGALALKRSAPAGEASHA